MGLIQRGCDSTDVSGLLKKQKEKKITKVKEEKEIKASMSGG